MRISSTPAATEKTALRIFLIELLSFHEQLGADVISSRLEVSRKRFPDLARLRQDESQLLLVYSAFSVRKNLKQFGQPDN
jgi:hypothetical protein